MAQRSCPGDCPPPPHQGFSPPPIYVDDDVDNKVLNVKEEEEIPHIGEEDTLSLAAKEFAPLIDLKEEVIPLHIKVHHLLSIAEEGECLLGLAVKEVGKLLSVKLLCIVEE